MRLLVRTAERRGVMKGIGAGQKVSGNHVNEIAHEGHVGAMPQGVGEQDLPLLKGPAPVAFLSPRRALRVLRLLEVPARIAPGPPWQVACVGIHQILTPLAQIPQLPLGGGLRPLHVSRDVLNAPPRRPPPHSYRPCASRPHGPYSAPPVASPWCFSPRETPNSAIVFPRSGEQTPPPPCETADGSDAAAEVRQ